MFTRCAFAAIVLAAICGCEYICPQSLGDPSRKSSPLKLEIAITAVDAVTNCSRNYTVVAGDTCDGICAKENVSRLGRPLSLRLSLVSRLYVSTDYSSSHSYQLATVNSGIIDLDCDNLYGGEVSSELADASVHRTFR